MELQDINLNKIARNTEISKRDVIAYIFTPAVKPPEWIIVQSVTIKCNM